MNKGWVILLSLVVFATSCKMVKKPSRKNVTIDSAATNSSSMIGPMPMEEPVSPPLLNADKKELIATLLPLWDRRIDYTTFKGKAKMHYEGSGQKQDFTANIRMAKDSVIWIHITAGMGIVNVARILITPDSFQLVNYLEKSVISMPIAEAQSFLPASVDFALLQSLLIGEVLSRTGQPVDATDFGGTWSLNIADAEAQQRINYNKVDSTMRSQQVILNNNGFAGMIQYGNYSLVSSRKFAISRAININSNNELHYLDMNFNNASFDEELEFPFSIPNSYSLNK
mgnify:CR=1 FL=1